MRMRRNLESLSLRLRSRCLRTATAYQASTVEPHFFAGIKKGSVKCYLLDQHVEVLGDFWCEACHVEITLSVIDQAEAVMQDEHRKYWAISQASTLFT